LRTAARSHSNRPTSNKVTRGRTRLALRRSAGNVGEVSHAVIMCPQGVGADDHGDLGVSGAVQQDRRNEGVLARTAALRQQRRGLGVVAAACAPDGRQGAGHPGSQGGREPAVVLVEPDAIDALIGCDLSVCLGCKTYSVSAITPRCVWGAWREGREGSRRSGAVIGPPPCLAAPSFKTDQHPPSSNEPTCT
jgi:hypothetical protein